MPRRTTASSLALALLGLVLAASIEIEGPGEPSCRCINPWANVSALPDGIYDAQNNCLRPADSELGCVPLNYGAEGCAAYDDTLLVPTCANVDGDARGGRPTYCESAFCFVDPARCDRRPEMTHLFDQTLLPDLAYSYATCGNLDQYTPNGHQKLLTSRKLRVSYPGDSGSGFTLLTLENGRKAGSVVSFAHDALRSIGAEWEVVTVSNSSSDAFPLSSFTACVHEVALNRTDMCIGNFWSTPTRRVMASFSAEIYQDLFFLVSFDGGRQSLTQQLARPFEPFTPGAWACIVAVTLVTSLAIFAVEAREDGGEFDGMPGWRALATSAYLSLTSLLGGGSIYRLRSVPARLMDIAFGLLILIVVASYTAQLASSLVRSAQLAQVDSVEAGIAQRLNFCALSAISDTLVSSTAQTLKDLLVPVANAKDAFAAMDAGECDLAILSANNIDAAFRGLYTPDDPTAHCNKLAVGDPVLAIGNALPVTEELSTSVAWLAASRMSEGAYLRAERDAKATYLPAPACATDGQSNEQGQLRGLTVEDMSGIFLFVGVALVISLIAHSCAHPRVRRAAGSAKQRAIAAAEKRGIKVPVIKLPPLPARCAKRSRVMDDEEAAAADAEYADDAHADGNERARQDDDDNVHSFDTRRVSETSEAGHGAAEHDHPHDHPHDRRGKGVHQHRRGSALNGRRRHSPQHSPTHSRSPALSPTTSSKKIKPPHEFARSQTTDISSFKVEPSGGAHAPGEAPDRRRSVDPQVQRRGSGARGAGEIGSSIVHISLDTATGVLTARAASPANGAGSMAGAGGTAIVQLAINNHTGARAAPVAVQRRGSSTNVARPDGVGRRRGST